MTAHARSNRVDAPSRSDVARRPRQAGMRLDARLEHRLATRAAEAQKEAVQRSTSADGDALDRGYGHGV